MKKMNFSYAALVITGLVVTLAGCSQKGELDPRTEPELVRIVEVGSSSGAGRAFTGVVSARVQNDLGFRVPGKITKRFVDTGQFVRAGQPLMTIDRTDYGPCHHGHERKPLLRQRRRLFKLQPMKPDIAHWSRAARSPLQSTIRSRPHRMRHKLTSLLQKHKSWSQEMRTPTHNLLRMRTVS